MTSPEPNTELSLEQFREALRAPAPPREAPARALLWLALVPFWPSSVAENGFPSDDQLVTGPPVTQLLEKLVQEGWAETAMASPPWTGVYYCMNRAQRRRALDRWREDKGKNRHIHDEVRTVFSQLDGVRKSVPLAYPPALSCWCRLASPNLDSGKATYLSLVSSTIEGISATLNSAVDEALRAARSLDLDGSPEAATWLDAAEPLAVAFGGAVRVAVARCQRELELHHRRSRDRSLLLNYQPRPELDQSFLNIVGDSTVWMIHYLGGGGVGKTMFLRHLQSHLAGENRLVTARVDFDHLNPDYPLRSPGLLLLSFAEELKLEAPQQAIDYLTKLSVEVTQVHAELERAQRDGRDIPLGFSAPGFAFCLQLFAEALRTIERSGRRPVLILDTCEELVRLRFDGALPLTVIETFKILVSLHQFATSLRVVFSGRRPLAQTLDNPGLEHGSLPERAEFVVCPILGFKRNEALELLQNYRREGRDNDGVVPTDLHEGILELSKSEDATGREWYNPFDVNLYASWAAADNTLTRDKLEAAGRHHYVRERVVARLRQDVRQCVPHLTLLGRFDEDLVSMLAPGIGDPASLWAELRQQEWIEADRNAPVQNASANQTVVAFWNVDEQMRKKLRAFYIDEMPTAWTEASRKVARLLERLTIDRAWPTLTPFYFQTAAEAMRSNAVMASGWWARVEGKILETQAWDWADRITASLLDDPESMKDHPLAAPVHALRANVVMHQSGESKALEGLWSAVERNAPSYPDDIGRRVLEYRAAAGFIAHRRYRPEILQEAYAREFETLMDRVPRLPPLLDEVRTPERSGLKRQILNTEVALIDNAVEVLEQVEWSAAPPSGLVAVILVRAMDLKQHTQGSFHSFGREFPVEPWIDIYCQRVKLLADGVDERWFWMDAWNSAPPEALRGPAFDYIPPDNPEARRLLECGRLVENGKIRRFTDGLAKEAFHVAVKKANLDEERLASQAYRLMPELSRGGAGEVVSLSLSVAGQHEKCEAHRKVPPLWATAIQVQAISGDVDTAIALLQRARSGARAEQLKWTLDQVSAYVNTMYLLAEPSSETPALPELPFREDTRDPVKVFMTTTSVSLGDGKDGTLTSERLAYQIERAEGLCAHFNLTLPISFEQLQNLPAGWRPWFARHLVVCLLGERSADPARRNEAVTYFRTLYGAELPNDLAFLAPADPAEAPAARGKWKEGAAGFFIAAVGGLFLFWLIRWVAKRLLGLDLVWWQTLLILLLIPFSFGLFIAASSFALPWLLRAYLRIASRWMSVESTVQAIPTGDDRRFRFESQLNYHLPLLSKFDWPRTTKQEKEVRFPSGQPYRNYVEPSSEPGSTKSMMVWLISQGRVQHVLIPDDESRSECWEAIAGMSTGRARTFSDCPFIFRRRSEKQWHIEEPFRGQMSIMSVSAMRDLSNWTVGLRESSRISPLCLTKLPGESSRQVGVLILQAEVSGNRMFIKDGASTSVGCGDIARLFPNLRLLFLACPDLGEAAARTQIDRVFARDTRSIAHELAFVAAPAVIALPRLPSKSTLIEQAIGTVTELVSRDRKNIVPPLQKAVRDIQEKIFSQCGMDSDDATELAYDVCFYAADSINMVVDITADDYKNSGRAVNA